MKLDLLPIDEKPQIMIIPMIDIIFFLLVFFMMSMLSMVVQKGIPLNLPAAATAEINLTENIPVSITADGVIYYEQEKVSLEELENRLWTRQQGGADIAVIMRGDAAVDYGNVVQVMDMVKNIGITKVFIATESPR